jgi:hypothetical protein
MNSDYKAARGRARAALAAALLGVTMLPMPAAEAQYIALPWSHPYYDGYPPPIPPGSVAAGETEPQYAPRDEPPHLPLAEIRRRVAALGFHLVATPRRKDGIYLAEAEDVHGLMHRLVFDAQQGNVIENTKLAAVPKKPKPVAIPNDAKAAEPDEKPSAAQTQ